MQWKNLGALSLVCFVCIAGCSSGSGSGSAASGGTGGSGGGSGGVTGGSLTGAWYGTGPDGDQCVVVCANNKLFLGDRPCDDTTASDFTSYLTYSATGTSLAIATPSSACWINSSPCANSSMSWTLNGETASIAWCGFTLNVDRVAGSSPLCDDAARTPC